MHASFRRWKDKTMTIRDELDKVQKQQQMTVKKNLTLANNLELAELAKSELQMMSE
jgi:hypothetical protein